ncbi:amidase [Nocardia farcinica]|uniref:amidase n=1 Tax=Nocardia farcinica TaxID=37329 RepID=UPI000BF871D6|nr:amidase [Nocardia farcinica]
MQSPVSRRSFLRGASVGAAVGATALPGLAHGVPLPRRPAPRLPDPATVAATDPAMLTALEAASLLQARTLHPVDLLDACLRRSADYDGATNAWIRTYPELAHDQAEQAAQRLAAGDAPLLCGLPIAVKDLYAVAGLPLTASSRVLDGNIAAGDATVWRRLREHGAVLLGHTHTDEFAIMTATPQVGNPWKTDDTAGGSSGGSAAALAARYAPLALGTDTGGSARLPASRCGVSAIKPTFGRCSKYGVIPVMWTRDHPAAMGRTLADAALLLSFMAGADANDPVTGTAPPLPAAGFPFTAPEAAKPLGGRVFGVPVAADRLPAELGRLFTEFLGVVTDLGGELREVRMPAEPEGLATGDAVELGMYHRQWIEQLGLFRPLSAAVVEVGLASLGIPSTDYLQYSRARATYQRAYNRLFDEDGIDALVLPGTATDGMPRSTAAAASILGADHVPVTWANYSGAPSLSLPAGRSRVTGLPFGVQLGGRPWGEADLLPLGLAIEAAAPHWRDVPPLRPNPRPLPQVGLGTPGPGPDPTNTDAAAPAFSFIPTTTAAPV